jgi:O-antigen/teichoic acid export membrane protein
MPISNRLNVPWTQSRRWGTRALFALMDQGLISGSNFVTGVILARWLGPAEYGAYALAFATFLLLSLLYQAVVLEPMSVFGGSTYRSTLRHYLGQLVWLQATVAAACIFLLVGAAAVSSVVGRSGQLAQALLGVSFAAPGVLLLSFARRALYLEYRSRGAAIGALLYTGMLLAAMWVIYRLLLLSALSAFIAMGTAALLTSISLLVRVRPRLRETRSAQELRTLGRHHWQYGRWALVSAFLIWLPWNVYYSVVGTYLGLATAGALRALLNLTMPMTQLYTALALLLLPRTASIAQAEGWAGAKRQAIIIAGSFTLVAALYWTMVIYWRAPLLQFLYSGQYANIAGLLPWLAIASVLSGTVFGPMCAFRAMQSPATVCWVFLVSSAIGVGVGIPATLSYGLSGVVLGISISSVLAVVIAAILLARRCARRAVPVA